MIENFLYKTIHIDNYEIIHNELVAYVHEYNREITLSNPYRYLDLSDVLQKCPSIDNWFKEKSIQPKVCAIIDVVGNGKNLIHVDHQKNMLALNFGIDIPEGSFTGMYKQIKGAMFESRQPNGVPRFEFFSNSEFSMLDKFDLHSPTVFNTQVPHGVFTPIGMRRISLSFRFVNDPWSLVE